MTFSLPLPSSLLKLPTIGTLTKTALKTVKCFHLLNLLCSFFQEAGQDMTDFRSSSPPIPTIAKKQTSQGKSNEALELALLMLVSHL